MVGKIWSIVWRLLWILILCLSMYGIVTTNKNPGLSGVLFVCLGCVILNIPYYIVKKVTETDAEWLQAFINWEFHPIRTIIIGLLVAPLISVMIVFCLIIEVFKIIFNRY